MTTTNVNLYIQKNKRKGTSRVYDTEVDGEKKMRFSVTLC